ncbi:MAG: hypothetical protein ABR510_14985, partial [Trueperaceae bacterium]
IKYWFSVSDAEQERRFQKRIKQPTKRWKLSPMDLESRRRWVEYSKAKDVMFAHTDIKQAPWWVVDAEVKKHARLNCIAHLLDQIPYEHRDPEPCRASRRRIPHSATSAQRVRPGQVSSRAGGPYWIRTSDQTIMSRQESPSSA